MRISAAAAIASLILLGACGSGDEAENSGVTAEEAAALNQTDDMMNASSDTYVPADESALGNGEVPMDDLGADTGELPVTDPAATNGQ